MCFLALLNSWIWVTLIYHPPWPPSFPWTHWIHLDNPEKSFHPQVLNFITLQSPLCHSEEQSQRFLARGYGYFGGLSTVYNPEGCGRRGGSGHYISGRSWQKLFLKAWERQNWENTGVVWTTLLSVSRQMQAGPDEQWLKVSKGTPSRWHESNSQILQGSNREPTPQNVVWPPCMPRHTQPKSKIVRIEDMGM